MGNLLIAHTREVYITKFMGFVSQDKLDLIQFMGPNDLKFILMKFFCQKVFLTPILTPPSNPNGLTQTIYLHTRPPFDPEKSSKPRLILMFSCYLDRVYSI